MSAELDAAVARAQSTITDLIAALEGARAASAPPADESGAIATLNAAADAGQAAIASPAPPEPPTPAGTVGVAATAPEVSGNPPS